MASNPIKMLLESVHSIIDVRRKMIFQLFQISKRTSWVGYVLLPGYSNNKHLRLLVDIAKVPGSKEQMSNQTHLFVNKKQQQKTNCFLHNINPPHSAASHRHSIMAPTSVDKMLETMMMQMLNPNQNADNVVCCNCFKVKKKESQRSSDTSCKCQKNNTPKKHKRRHRKLKKSCLKTIVCLTKMSKDGGECRGCLCDPCNGNMDQDIDKRFCSKCGQPLPGMVVVNQPIDQPDQQCLEQLQRCQQDCRDMAVQTNVDHQQQLSVRIKVCPCPNVNSRSNYDQLHHSVSLPELSSTNPRLVDGASSGNLVSSRVLCTRFEDSNQGESSQPHRITGLNENSSEWPVDMASMKKLALNLAKVRLVEEAACWEREFTRRNLQQQRQQDAEQPIDQLSQVDQRKSANTDGGPEIKRRSYVSFEDGQSQTAPGKAEFKSQIGTQTYPNYIHEMDLCNEYPDFGVSYTPRQAIKDGCCAGTDVYCYSPENGPSAFGKHCEPACTCGNAGRFQPYQFSGPYSGYHYHSIPRQEEYGIQQDRPRLDVYSMPYGSLRNGPRSPCQ